MFRDSKSYQKRNKERRLVFVFSIILGISLSAYINSLNGELIEKNGEYKANNFNYAFSIRGDVSLSEAQIRFIATYFNSLMVKDIRPWFVGIIKKVKSLNSDFMIVKYTNGLYNYSYHPEDENCYAHNPESQHPNKRIKDLRYGGWLMDPCATNKRTDYLPLTVKIDGTNVVKNFYPEESRDTFSDRFNTPL